VNRITKYLFPMILMILTSCGVTNDESQSEPSPQEDVSTDASSVAVPEALQSITPRVTCSSVHGACLSAIVCHGTGGHQVTATGCASGRVCCVLPST
jgi:hypothetical protein